MKKKRKLHGKEGNITEDPEIKKSMEKFISSRTKQQQTVKKFVFLIHVLKNDY